jgi:DNA-binding HxlR family transcriptional regulator
MTHMTAEELSSAEPGAPAGDCRPCDAGLARAFEFLGKRWNGVILGTLRSGPAGFAELRRGVGAITDSVLSDRLSELAAAGLVLRSVSDDKPPSVSYELSGPGTALLPALDELSRWASENLGNC